MHENSWQLTKDMASRGLTFYVSCPNWEHIYVASPLKHCTAVERCKWRTHTSSSIGWTWPIIKTNSHCEANMCQRANMLLLACFPCFCTKRNPTLAPSYISWDNYLLCASSRWNINISNHSYQKPSSPLSLSQWRIFEGGLDENLHAGVNLFFLATNKIFFQTMLSLHLSLAQSLHFSSLQRQQWKSNAMSVWETQGGDEKEETRKILGK